MKWLEVRYSFCVTDCDLICDAFIDAGSKGVLIEDSNTPNDEYEDRFGEVYNLNPEDYPSSGITVKGYFPDTEQGWDGIHKARNRLYDLEYDAHHSFLITELKEEDWENSWKDHYGPIQISDHLVIKPSWLSKSDDNHITEILLDPGMAFGSGTHETTRLCLQLLEQHLTTNSKVIDVGTGSGILAIAAAKLGANAVYGVDLDEMAVVRANENMILNQCEFLIETNNLMDGVHALTWRPNFIIANILAPIIIGMLEDVKSVLNSGDKFICSGIIAEEEIAVLDSLSSNGFEILEIKSENGWVAIVSRKL